MATDTTVTLGDPRGEHVVLHVSRRERETSLGDYDDDNWLVGRISLRVSGFHADYPANLRSDDFAALRDALRRHAARQSASEEWASMEPYLVLKVDTDDEDDIRVGPDVLHAMDASTSRFLWTDRRRIARRPRLTTPTAIPTLPR